MEDKVLKTLQVGETVLTLVSTWDGFYNCSRYEIRENNEIKFSFLYGPQDEVRTAAYDTWRGIEFMHSLMSKES